ncbi:MAG: PEGA domain-containing protein [Candidatus Marinimicrobia bacterium]|nr:PEGA domain-containing protein [Candidatus Neomarinimicrobiota bacterium]
MNGTSQDVGFASDPAGAKVTVDGDYLGITPLTVSLTRRRSHTVRIEAAGYPPFETPILRKFSGWAFYPDWYFKPIDYLSGGLFKLKPARLQVRLADGSIVQQFDKTMWNIPPLNKGRIAGEILGGVVAGVIFAYGLLGADPNSDVFLVEDAIIFGSFIGSPLGVYLVGNLGNQTGSLDMTVQGSLFGILGTLGLAILIVVNDIEPVMSIEHALLIGPSIGATIGFNLDRRFKAPIAEAETGFINLGEGQVSLAAPLIYMRPNPFITGDWVPTVDLVRVKFR